MRPVHVLTAFMLTAATTVSASAQQNTAQPDGAQIFTLVCAMCHSVEPPAKVAPPMSHAVAYYLRKYGEATKAADAIVAYLKDPAADRSAMPAHAVERFGLMPSQAHLGDAQLRAVARYVITLADTAHVRGNHQHPPPGR